MIGETLAYRVVARDSRAIARALSIVEGGGPTARDLVAALRPSTGRASIVGVTGPPGVGKSTLVDRLLAAWRHEGRRVAALVVDPSSPYSGGALLGDRVRMQAHAADADVFIRSMATRGQMGGLARATAEAAAVLDAAGFDMILLETVGVGQDEIDVVHAADCVVVMTLPGAGDDIQMLKAGVMEIGDIFVVNKADREGADRAVASIEAAFGLDDGDGRRRPPVLRVVASTGEGVPDVVQAVARCRESAKERRGDGRPTLETRASGQVATVDHVAVATTNPDRLATLLHDLFGATVDAPETLDAQRVRVRFIDMGSTRIELVEPTAETSPIQTFLEKRGAGLHHVAILVDDLEAALAAMAARGVRLLDPVPRPGAHGTRVAFVHPADTDGVLIELVTRRTSRAIG